MLKKTAIELDAEAADWAARTDRGLTPGEDRQFDAWLADDVRASGAYGRMRALALSTERARALGTDFDPQAFAPPPSWSRRHSFQLGGAIAATLLIGAGGTWQFLRSRGRFSTGKGDTKVIALQDGSVVTLNTASEIRVRYSEALRSVELVRGEALFDVSKNKARPFVVIAGDMTVRVVGTSFTVRNLETAPVEVLVREGVVDVFNSRANSAPARITANTMAQAGQGETVQITARPIPVAQVQRQMAWQNGQIAFEGETLAQAASAFSRYSDTRIVIADPALAREEIAGLFKATDPVGFAKTIAISLNAHADVTEGEVRLTR
jgi:transmembrane sensor